MNVWILVAIIAGPGLPPNAERLAMTSQGHCEASGKIYLERVAALGKNYTASYQCMLVTKANGRRVM